MNVTLTVNGINHTHDYPAHTSLLTAVRQLGFQSVKFGDEDGFSGADTVLLDGKPVNAGLMLAAQAEGHKIATLEALGEHPDQGWRKTDGLHPLQKAFIENGAIQCGYCTPAQILAAKALLDKSPHPTEAEVREALAGVLCRCTGYAKPVQAVMAVVSGQYSGNSNQISVVSDQLSVISETQFPDNRTTGQPVNRTTGQPDNRTTEQPDNRTTGQPDNRTTGQWQTVGKPEIKVDAVKLAQGKPAFTADLEKRDLLHAKVLRSPHAHARIKRIDASKARALPGVAAVLTWQDIPRVVYSTAGQSDPIPGPLDCFSLDNKVRFVGDRVAFVAAETPEIAEKALGLIEVEYEILPAILDMGEAMKPGAIQIHDEPEYVNFADSDPHKNLAAEIRIDIGNVEKGFAEADEIFEAEYEVPKVQQAHIEPHVALTFWDEDDRLVIRTSTQVPFHVRRMLAPVLNLPIKRIRVIKPRIGGGFGGKQEVLMEDVAAHLTIATRRPVLYEYTREEEFIGARSRHPMRVRMKTGVKRDGTITANEMYALSDTGANGAHALTVTGNTGHKAMALYVGDGEYRKSPNIRFYANIVYTNTPPAGAFRGYGVPQGYWPLDRHMEKIARALNLDPLKFRLKNALHAGEYHPFSTAWNEGREPRPEIINTVGLEECVRQGQAAIGWEEKFGNETWRNSLSSSPVERLSSSPVERLSGSPVERLSGSPVERFSSSPVERLSGSPVERLSGSPVERLSSSPVERLSSSPVERLSGSPVERLSGSPVERFSSSPVERLSDSTGTPDNRNTEKPERRNTGKRKGIGVALVMQGTAIPYLDMGGASIKMNDDGSFNLLVGATDLGTGSDTVLGQMAAEVLGVPLEDILVYSSDTDFTPFDVGAYASSTTYISGTAVVNAARVVALKIQTRAAEILSRQRDKDNEDTSVPVYLFTDIRLQNRMAIAPDGRSIPLSEIAIDSLHRNNQEQIMGVGSYVSPASPPPFAAQFAEVTVDTETGAVTVNQLVMAVDSGTIINPQTASGQIEGGMTQALGYAVCEEMRYDELGRARERDLRDYHIFRADEMPTLKVIFVETFEPSHPFGVKAVAEIPMDGVAPAVGNAIRDALGVEIDSIPITPEKVWRALSGQ